MTARPHKPVTMPPWRVEISEDSEEAIWRSHPEKRAGLARDTALILLGRAEDVTFPDDMAHRVRAFVDEGGLDDLAELWADSPALSLPGALWRLYRVRDQIVKQPDDVAALLSRGQQSLNTIDPVVAGLDDPVSAGNVVELIDSVFFGALEGELSWALIRVAALAKLITHGLATLPDGDDTGLLTRTSLAWGVIAQELMDAAALERRSGLVA